MDVHSYFLHELKYQGMIVVNHITGDTSNADIFTKNVASANCHILLCIRNDENMSMLQSVSSGEAV